MDGPITIARAPAIAASACSLGRACSAPRYSSPSIIPAARSRIMNSWKEHQPAEPVRTHVRTGSSLIGSTRERTPIAPFSRASAAVGERPSASMRARSMHQARSRSPRLNQTSTPSSRSASITAKLSPRRPQPRSSISVGQPEGDEVGVGRDVRAVDLDVVAGVDDRGQTLGAGDVGEPARELGAAGAAGEDHDVGVAHCHSCSGRLVRRMPGVGLVAGVDGDQQRGQRLGRARHLQLAAVDAAQPVDALDQLRRAALVRARVAAHEHVLVERVLEVAQRGGADGVQRGDHVHALRRHLERLLGGRALPHAEHARGLAADGGRERHGGVDQQLPGRERVLEVGERLGLVAKGHAQDHDAGGARGGRRAGVVVPRERAVGHDRAGALGGVGGAGGVARADRDRHARAREPQREAEAERPGGADDRDGVVAGGWHGGRV